MVGRVGGGDWGERRSWEVRLWVTVWAGFEVMGWWFFFQGSEEVGVTPIDISSSSGCCNLDNKIDVVRHCRRRRRQLCSISHFHLSLYSPTHSLSTADPAQP